MIVKFPAAEPTEADAGDLLARAGRDVHVEERPLPHAFLQPNGQDLADAIYKAVAVFRVLVGGKVWVHVERRPLVAYARIAAGGR